MCRLGFPAGLEVYSPLLWRSAQQLADALLAEHRARWAPFTHTWDADSWYYNALIESEMVDWARMFTPSPAPPAFLYAPGTGTVIARARFGSLLWMPPVAPLHDTQPSARVVVPELVPVAVWSLVDPSAYGDQTGKVWHLDL